jgi:hypothetical protein
MCMFNRQHDPRRRWLMVLGNLSLVAAMVVGPHAHPVEAAARAWTDGLIGLLYGVSIGANLTAIVLCRRCQS